MSNPTVNNLLVVDLETTGPNPIRHDVVAVGMVPFTDPQRATVYYVRPSAPQWSAYAQLHFQKYRRIWQKEALPPAEACAAIERWIEDEFGGHAVTPIGHNIGFDVGFLRKLAFLAGKDEIDLVSHRALDTHTMLWLLYMRGDLPESALTSDGAFGHFGIEIPEMHRHTAFADVLATRELAIHLLQAIQLKDAALQDQTTEFQQARQQRAP
jgi:DNA polymerase III epsilon subunit-like protein